MGLFIPAKKTGSQASGSMLQGGSLPGVSAGVSAPKSSNLQGRAVTLGSPTNLNLNDYVVSGGGGANTNNPTSTGLGGSAVSAGPSRAQLDPLLASLDSLEEILANRNAQSRGEYSRAIKGYDAQDAIDRRAYDDNVFQNENTFTSNNQAALLNAANAATGLKGVLSSLGGLAGSGVDVIRRLVGLAANDDTGAGRKTFETNATNLQNSWSQAEQNQRQRREDAEALLQNNLQNNEAGVLTSRQGIFQQLANLYGDGTSEGNSYASKAAALSAPIARTTRATVAPYQAASSLFSPGALQQYLAGTQNLNVSASSGSEAPINSPVYSTRKREQLTGVA